MDGPELKSWRVRRGWSRPEAAAALGVSVSTLVNYEAGVRRDTGDPVIVPRYIALACAAIDRGVEVP